MLSRVCLEIWQVSAHFSGGKNHVSQPDLEYHNIVPSHHISFILQPFIISKIPNAAYRLFLICQSEQASIFFGHKGRKHFFESRQNKHFRGHNYGAFENETFEYIRYKQGTQIHHSTFSWGCAQKTFQATYFPKLLSRKINSSFWNVSVLWMSERKQKNIKFLHKMISVILIKKTVLLRHAVITSPFILCSTFLWK